MSRLTKFPLTQLELYALLVYYGVKDSYLVDCCCMELHEASAFVRHLLTKYSLTQGRIFTVQLEFDILFVNRDLLRKKVSDLENKQNLPLVIDVSLILSIRLDLSAQLECIVNIFKEIVSVGDSVDEFVVPVTDILRSTVGLPFVAGWVLGYPCLYRALELQFSEQTELSEGSNMLNLVKFSILADVYHKGIPVSKTKGKAPRTLDKIKTDTNNPCSLLAVEVMGFSIPERLLDCDENIQAQLQLSVDRIVTDMQRHATLIGTSCYIKVSNCRVVQSVHTVPKLAL